MADTAATSEITVVPANEASWEDIQAVLGTRGGAAICQCQRFKLQPKESFGSTPVEERAFRLREQTSCGDPDADTTSGLVAYREGEPVGWCAVEPRDARTRGSCASTASRGWVETRTRATTASGR